MQNWPRSFRKTPKFSVEMTVSLEAALVLPPFIRFHSVPFDATLWYNC
jgi:hypothetical protein